MGKRSSFQKTDVAIHVIAILRRSRSSALPGRMFSLASRSRVMPWEPVGSLSTELTSIHAALLPTSGSKPSTAILILWVR